MNRGTCTSCGRAGTVNTRTFALAYHYCATGEWWGITFENLAEFAAMNDAQKRRLLGIPTFRVGTWRQEATADA